MFEKIKKAIQSPEPQKERAMALALIQEALEDLDTATDGAFLEAYISGSTEMALALGAISPAERIEYTTLAHNKAQALKAKKEPVYKKKGVYEYNGYYILKDFAADNGAGSACWCVKKIGAEEIIAKGLTFKEAIKVVDNQ